MVKSCKIKEDPYTSLLINCLIHVLILFTILSIFFIVYVSQLEERTFKNEIGSLINEEFNNINEENKKSLQPYLEKINLKKVKEIYSNPDSTVTINNQWLLRLSYSIIAFLLLLVIILVGVLFFSCKMCVNLKDILIENIVIFLLVGVVEICFFLYIASQYVPVAPSVITTTMIETLQKNFS